MTGPRLRKFTKRLATVRGTKDNTLKARYILNYDYARKEERQAILIQEHSSVYNSF